MPRLVSSRNIEAGNAASAGGVTAGLKPNTCKAHPHPHPPSPPPPPPPPTGPPTHVHEAANSYSLVPATPRAAIAMIRT
eukprot:COSAG01_NODE_2366_length_7816_cov_3.797460_1_plen_79_part_00